MSKPQQKPTDKPPRSGCGALVWVTGSCLIFYVLSTGPIAKLVQSQMISGRTTCRVYAPLVWLVDNFPPAQDFFDWYLKDVWKASPEHLFVQGGPGSPP